MSKFIGDCHKYISNDDFIRSDLVNKLPDQCPICHKYIIPKVTISYDYGLAKNCYGYKLEVVFICTNLECKDLFIGYYYKENNFEAKYTLKSIAPFVMENIEFSEEIIKLSSSFVDIYNQSHKAERYNLLDVAGPGYRKALEFLVKDYAISKNESEKDKIEKVFLSNCINTYIADEKIKLLAERATWLGNDEVHYTKKWIDKDINDLKILIKLTTNYINNEIVADNYLRGM